MTRILQEDGTSAILQEDGASAILQESVDTTVDASFLQGASSTSDLTTYTFSSQNLGAADTDRYIVVGVESRGLGTGITLSSVTVGGVSATIVVQREDTTSNSNIAALAIAAVPTGTTGDVVVTFSSGRVRCAIQLYRLVNIDSPTPTDTGSSVANDPTTLLDVSAGGVGIGCGMIGSDVRATWVGLTEDLDEAVEATIGVTSAHDTFLSAQSGMTTTIDFATVSGNGAVGVFASWALTESESAALPLFNHYMMG